MLMRDVDWTKGFDHGAILVAYAVPVWRKVRRGKKFVWKVYFYTQLNPHLITQEEFDELTKDEEVVYE